MRIGFDISAQSLPRSGIGRYQYQLLKALLEQDRENFYHLYAFNVRHRDRFKEIQFPSENYKVDVLPIPQRLITMWWMMSRFPSVDQLASDCDIYQVSEICAQPVKRAKSVAFVHDLTTLLFPEHHTKSNRFLHNQRFKKMGTMDGILTNSEATKADIVNYLKIDPEKIVVTHLGADSAFRPMSEEEVNPFLEKYDLNKPYILFVGTLEPRKNVKTLISAFNRLKKERQIPHELVMAGQRGWLFDYALKAIEKSPYKNDIRHLNYVPEADLPALMNGATVFAYPSFYEGFGLPVLEAMQCGTPVVTSPVSALPEVGGEACLYANPHSETELANRLYEIINDSELQKQLSERGIERSKLFSWEMCAKRTLDAYKFIAGR